MTAGSTMVAYLLQHEVSTATASYDEGGHLTEVGRRGRWASGLPHEPGGAHAAGAHLRDDAREVVAVRSSARCDL